MTGRRRLDVLLWLLLAALTTLFVLRTLMPAQARLSSGFLAYYAAGDLVASGTDPLQLYDASRFNQRVSEISHGTVHDVYLGNTPALAVAWMPLSQLRVDTTRRVWIALNAVFLVLTVACVLAGLPRHARLPAAALLVSLLTLSAPARDQIFHGQMYGLLLLLHAIALRAYERHEDALAGVMLALTLMLKLSGWPIVVLLLLRRRWRALFWVAAVALALFWLTLPWTGIEVWREAVFVQMPASAAEPTARLSAYQTVSSLWQHLWSAHPVYNPQPVADLPGLAKAGIALTTVAACAALLLRRLSAPVQYAAALTLTVLLSPLAEQYHYVLVLLPLALLCIHAGFTRSAQLGAVLLIAALLIAAPIDYKTYRPSWSALLDYPRLAGGWIVFLTLLWIGKLRTA